MIPSIVKVPVSVAQQLAVGALHVGVSGATALLHRVLPGGGSTSSQGATPTAAAPSPGVDNTPPEPSASADPVTQPPAPEPATARKAPAKKAPAKKAPAKKAAAKKAPAKKAPAKKPAAKKSPSATSATAAQKAVAKKTPARQATPSKPAAVLDEPVAPVDEDAVVYSSGPEVAASLPVEDLEKLRAATSD